MKKKVYAARLGVTALALTLVTTCLMGSTLARYVTEVTGSATATVAKWSFTASDAEGSANFTNIDLGRTAYTDTTIADKVIAPGTSGSFNIAIDGSGSDVGIDYEINLKAADSITFPDDMVFSTEAITEGKPGKKLADLDPITGTINVSGNMKETVTVYWAWDFGKDDTAAANDNNYAGEKWEIDITVTGKQTTPTATPASAS
ncbi:hypothetical protein [Holdemania massiliensis]|uniref:hypothetical protein n=1 Tax=Holdemania massiliensis TaxID=1468449 RepID=UPI001F058E0A|nr:hypothetical protein [Holdemania massiliensis]MCH1942558.1 hypothetical protein [Holdemania massiliensis]